MNISPCICCNSKEVFIEHEPEKHLYCHSCGHKSKIEVVNQEVLNYETKSSRTSRLIKDTQKKINERLNFMHECINQNEVSNTLEIGAAEGYFAKSFLNNFRNVEYHAVELSQDSYECEKIVNKIYRKKLEDLSLTRESYDLILSFHVLEHLQNPNDLLKEVIKILKNDGQFIIEVPNEHGNKIVPWDYNKEHLQLFTVSSIASLLMNNGFQVSKVELGGFESPYYNDSIRIAAVKKTNNKTFLYKEFLSNFIKNNDLAFWGAGGDFYSYLWPYLDKSDSFKIFDKNYSREQQDDFKILAPDQIANHSGKVMICSYQFEDEIEQELVNNYSINPNRILKLSNIFRKKN